MSDNPPTEPPDNQPLYDTIGLRYAAMVDSSPYNMYYERPATLSLLPPLANTRVLDVGCGSGWYAEYLIGQGAHVTSCDVSATMVELTRARLGPQATVIQADLCQPLSFAEAGSFDLVVAPLVLHYLKDWEPVLGEFQRVLAEHGILVFSTHHPSADYQYHQPPSYFGLDLLEEHWSKVGLVRFYRRPLTAMVDSVINKGFTIERLLEPQPTAAFRQVDPERYATLMRFPTFLLIRARRT